MDLSFESTSTCGERTEHRKTLDDNRHSGSPLIALTVLLSAWLVFQVQPMAGKRILPWFGGGPAVWSTAMLFFQSLLLVGYAYAHATSRLLRPRTQAIVHALLLIVAMLALALAGPIARDRWKPVSSDHPQWRILLILAGSVGLPYAMLSATAPLVQSWIARSASGGSPYRLYALSNVGSLAALISYPLLVEPFIGLQAQGWAWFALFAIFVIVCAGSAAMMARSATLDPACAEPRNAPHARHAGPSIADRIFWIALPACASVVLLAVTNYLCQDVAPAPLLWIAPLTIYLLTFIVAFGSDRAYRRGLWMIASIILSMIACVSWIPLAGVGFNWQVVIHLAVLFAIGMSCHAEVAKRRPSGAYLTTFYLSLAAGGAMGGMLVAVVAPLMFSNYYELPLGILGAWMLGAISMASDRSTSLNPQSLARVGVMFAWIVIVLLAIVFSMIAWIRFGPAPSISIARARNFFGVLEVQQAVAKANGRSLRRLIHGSIAHGAQFLGADHRQDPTQYYDASSGIGQLLRSTSVGSAKRIGVVGLGAGTIAAYANAGDAISFYEIDPHVVDFAERYFTYLSDARDRGAGVRVIINDARLAIEREPAELRFDVLVLDAFAGDAIPVHLLTAEACDAYAAHLQSDGVLAVHITNRNLDLSPVVLAMANRMGCEARIVSSKSDEANAVQASDWVLIYSARWKFARTGSPFAPGTKPILWTDDSSTVTRIWK